MANFALARMDTSNWTVALDALGGPIKESLARRMAVGAGVPLRDEAKARVPASVGPYNPNSRGTQQAETLRSAIYLAFDKKESNEHRIRYNISWNNSVAWWGRLVEFPHKRPYLVYFDKKRGVWVTVKSVPNPRSEKAVKDARPFLRPAYDMMAPRLVKLMVQTGQQELPRVLTEHGWK